MDNWEGFAIKGGFFTESAISNVLCDLYYCFMRKHTYMDSQVCDVIKGGCISQLRLQSSFMELLHNFAG